MMISGIWAIENFARYHLKTAQQRAKLQNEVSFVLEHMQKNMANAIGNARNSTALQDLFIKVPPIVGGGGACACGYYVDAAASGTSPGDGVPGTQGDHWEYYLFSGTVPLGSGTTAHQVFYYPNCAKHTNFDGIIDFCSDFDILTTGGHITHFSADVVSNATSSNNYVDVNITACWDPAEAKAACGTSDNPSVSMQERIKMPMVSAR